MAPIYGEIIIPKNIHQAKKGKQWTKLYYSIRNTITRNISDGTNLTDPNINSVLTGGQEQL